MCEIRRNFDISLNIWMMWLANGYIRSFIHSVTTHCTLHFEPVVNVWIYVSVLFLLQMLLKRKRLTHRRRLIALQLFSLSSSYYCLSLSFCYSFFCSTGERERPPPLSITPVPNSRPNQTRSPTSVEQPAVRNRPTSTTSSRTQHPSLQAPHPQSSRHQTTAWRCSHVCCRAMKPNQATQMRAF